MLKQAILPGILIVTLLLFGCQNKEEKVTIIENASTVEALHSGFYQCELTKKIINKNDTAITIVATGHLYPLLYHPLAYRAFIDSIEAQNPDYVFLLGDLVYNNTQKEWDTVFSYFKNLKNKLYFSPGNHDLNFHYERYFGKYDNRAEAELRYIDNVGYRYKILEDNLLNYVFINLNDSLERIMTYLNAIEQELNPNKPKLLFSSQCIWHNKQQDPNDVKTWPAKSFGRDEMLPQITSYDYLIHGDWGGNFYRGFWPKENEEKFQVIAVGNRKAGDSLYIGRLDVFKDTIIGVGIRVHPPTTSTWYTQKK